MKTTLILVAGLVLAGCRSESNKMAWDTVDAMKKIPARTSPDGAKYKLVRIEGRLFVATPSYNGYWSLAGPLPEQQP